MSVAVKEKTSGGLEITKEIIREWGLFPGKQVILTVGLALSGEMVERREKMLGLPTAERNAALDDFRISLLADVLQKDPEILDIARAKSVLTERANKIIAEMRSKLKDGDELPEEAIESTLKNIKLSAADIEGLKEPLPGFPAGSLEDLTERAQNYFSQKDSRGRLVFQRLLEEVIDTYWNWALPRPTFSASEFALIRQDISTKN